MPRRRTAPSRATAALVALIVVLAGCQRDGAGIRDAAGRHCRPVAAAGDTGALPTALDLGSFATVTQVVRDGGFVNATAFARGTLRDVHRSFSRVVRRAGYSIVGSENEVVEADVYFARGPKTTGAAKFIQTACDGRVRIQLFVGRSGG